MNYIAEIYSFNIFIVKNPIHANGQALWYRLLAYANQFGWKSDFTVTNTRLIEDLGISKSALDRARNILVQKGLVQYTQGSGNQCGTYKMISIANLFSNNSDAQTEHNPDTNRTECGTQSGPLNKLNQTKPNKKEIEKEKVSVFGEYQNVKLTPAQLDKLKKEFPEDYEQRIEALSEYMASSGKHYENHLATIRGWERKNRNKEDNSPHEAQPKTGFNNFSTGQTYDYDALEQASLKSLRRNSS